MGWPPRHSLAAPTDPSIAPQKQKQDRIKTAYPPFRYSPIYYLLTLQRPVIHVIDDRCAVAMRMGNLGIL